MADEARMLMEDVGTRLRHLCDLRDLWAEMLEILQRRNSNYSTKEDKEKIVKLENALELIHFHMQKDYNDFEYRREINTIRRTPGLLSERGEVQ